MLPSRAIIDQCLKATSSYEFVSYRSIFGEDPCGSIMKFGEPVEEGQYGLPVFPKIFPSGLISLAPRWTPRDYHDFYKLFFAPLYNLELKPDVGLMGIKKNYEDIFEFFRDDSDLEVNTILEVGSGPGFGLNHFMNLTGASQAYVIEGSDSSVAELTKLDRVDILGSSVYSIVETLPQFDICIMRHVVEHMENPINELKVLVDACQGSPAFYIAVPDMLNPRTELRDYDDWVRYWFRAPHIHYFNRFTISQVLDNAGLNILKFLEINNEIRIVCKKKNKRTTNDLIAVPNAFAQQISVLERLLGSQEIFIDGTGH